MRTSVVEAWSEPDHIIEAIRLKGPGYVFAVQWHPEFHAPDDPSFVDDTPILDEFLAAAAQHKSAAYTQARNGYSVRTDRFRYTEWTGANGGAELYDHMADPNEFTNLATDPAHAETVKQMREQLQKVPPAPLPPPKPDAGKQEAETKTS